MVVCILGSDAFLSSDEIRKAPLPTVGNLPRYSDMSQDILVPLKESEINKMGAVYTAKPVESFLNNGSNRGAVMTMQNHQVHSYGGGMNTGTQGGNIIALNNSSSNSDPAISVVNIPTVNRRNIQSQGGQRVQSQSSADVAAVQGAMAVSSVAAASGISLGYEDASGYMGGPRRSAADSDLPPTVGDSWEDWLNNNGIDPGSTSKEDLENAWNEWLGQFGGSDNPDGKDDFNDWYNNMPISDGVPYVLLLVVGYTIIRRKRIQTKTNK